MGLLCSNFKARHSSSPHLKLRWETRGSSRVATGILGNAWVASRESGLLLSCEGHLVIPLESLHGNRGSSQVVAGNSVFLSSCNRDLGIPLELQEGSQALSHVEAWTSTFLSSGKRGVSPPFELRWGIRDFSELQQGSWTSCHVVRGNSGFHSSHCRGIRSYLGSRGNSLSFPLVAGNSGFLLSCDGDLGIHLMWQQGSQDSLELRWGSRVSSRFAAGESGLLWSCSRNLGFFSSCCWKLRVSSRVTTGD